MLKPQSVIDRFLLILSISLTAVCYGLFFNAAFSIPNVDDLFFIPWAAELAVNGRHENTLLSEQFPDLTQLYLQTRAHMIAAAAYFRFAGVGRGSVVDYQFWCFAVVSVSFALLALSHKMRIAVVFGPLIFAVMYALSGFRLEVTGVILWMLGLALLYGKIPQRQSGMGQEGYPLVWAVMSGVGKLFLALAPIAAPSLFAWSLGAILAYDFHRLVIGKVKLGKIFLQDLLVLSLAVLVLLISIDFNVFEFISQFFFHASRALGGGMNFEALFRGMGFALIAWFLSRNGSSVALIVAALALGQLIAAGLHDKSLIRNIAASMIFLLTVDGLIPKPYRIFAWGMAFVASVLLAGNLILFQLFAEPAGKYAVAIRTDYAADLVKMDKVAIDEAMAHHVLDQKTAGAIAWTWRNRFPKNRPQKLAELDAGEVWYVSKYTLFGYLKGRHDIARRLAGIVRYEHTPQIGCWIGRQSCNLPKYGWGIMRFERVGKTVLVKDYERGEVIKISY